MSKPSYRILVVEDDADTAESNRLLLEILGHQVEVARTGTAGVEAARRFQPQIVLCDIGLGGSMNGHAVARALRQDERTASIFLIAVTGHGRDEDHIQAIQAGFHMHLLKPVSLQELQRALARAPVPVSTPQPAE